MTWIAVDWGGSALRAWRMKDEVAVAEAIDRSAGANVLEPADFEHALVKLIAPWREDGVQDVVVCGVAGSREGWFEAPYTEVPCLPETLVPVRVPTKDTGIRVYMMPGLAQSKPKPAVLRGEETQIAGFLLKEPDFDGVICLPGTHSKWAQVSAGEVVSFDTALTGEIFELLSKRSVLRHSILAGDPDGHAFDAGVATTLAAPERLATELSALRAADILHDAPKPAAHARLSGLLIGAEIAALKPYWLGQQVALIGAHVLCGLYARALSTQGVPAQRYGAPPLTQAGLYAALHEVDARV